MKLSHDCLALLLAVCVAAPAIGRDVSSPDSLRPLVNCPFGKQLQALSVDRRSGTAPWRAVATSFGSLRVSSVDGYRVMLGQPGGAPIVNLKLEKSAPGKLADDRTAILAQMTSFAARPNAPVTPFKVVTRNGIEVMMLEDVRLDRSGPVGIYTLVSEKANVVATAYLLNQRADRRGYKNAQEYTALRDEFIGALSSCMASQP